MGGKMLTPVAGLTKNWFAARFESPYYSLHSLVMNQRLTKFRFNFGSRYFLWKNTSFLSVPSTTDAIIYQIKTVKDAIVSIYQSLSQNSYLIPY